MGTRRTLVAATPGAGRDARRLALPPLTALEEDNRLFALDDWRDERAADDDADGIFATLHAPETAAAVDFTGVLPTVTRDKAPASRRRANADARRVQQTAGVRDRVASGTRRLAEIGTMRPVVRVPGKTEGNAAGRKRGARTAKLPPVWVLANLAILLFASLAIVVPHAIQADAAAGCRWYTVRAGDTLGNIGWANHTGALTLAKANHIPNPNLIYVGQRLCIPVQQGAQAASAPAPKPASPVSVGNSIGAPAPMPAPSNHLANPWCNSSQQFPSGPISQWTVPPSCYSGIYSMPGVSLPTWGYCNWVPEYLHMAQFGNSDRALFMPSHGGYAPRVGATVFYDGNVQGASSDGHYNTVVAVGPNGWNLVVEANFYWRGGGYAKIDFRYIHNGPGVDYRW